MWFECIVVCLSIKGLTEGPKYVMGTSTVDAATIVSPPTTAVKVDADRQGGSAWEGKAEATTIVVTPVKGTPFMVVTKVEAVKYDGSSWLAMCPEEKNICLKMKGSVENVDACWWRQGFIVSTAELL